MGSGTGPIDISLVSRERATCCDRGLHRRVGRMYASLTLGVVNKDQALAESRACVCW